MEVTIMSTETQINANRLNSQKSTGPRTPDGKAKVSQNAVTHGLTALRPILTNEDPDEYALFRDDFFRHHVPEGILEHSLAEYAVNTLWRLQRTQTYETLVLNTLIKEATDAAKENVVQASVLESNSLSGDSLNPSSLFAAVLHRDFSTDHNLERIQRYELKIERSYFRTVKELRQLQSLRIQQNEGKLTEGKSCVALAKQDKPNPVQSKSQIPNTVLKSNIEHRKPSMIDPIKLLENIKTNPIDLDPLTKIMMKKDNFQRLTKKAM
jgi:hypothetical protein